MTAPASSVVTVCLAVRDGMPFLPAAVASILGQTLGGLALVVVDDGSRDATQHYLTTLDDPRVRVIRQEPAGLAAALNRCIASVDTPLIARMDADDLARPQRLAQQVAFMGAHPEVVACGTWIEYFTEGGRCTLPQALPCAHDEIVRALTRGGHGFCHPAMVYRTAAARRVGGYRERGPGQLTQFALALAGVGELANLDRVLLAKRLHSASVSWREARAVAAAERRAVAAWRGYGAATVSTVPPLPTRREALTTALRARSQIAYRKALVALLRGDTVAAALHAGFASLCDPARALRRMVRLSGRRP